MLKQHIQIRNGSTAIQVIADPQLPNGRIGLQPGEEYGLPAPVYDRVRRRCQFWMVNAEVPPAVVAEPEPEVIVEPAAPEPEATVTADEPKPKARKRAKEE